MLRSRYGWCIGERPFHPHVNPDVGVKFPCWLSGRLDSVSSDGQCTLDSVDNWCRMTRRLRNKKALATLERTCVGGLRAYQIIREDNGDQQ